MLPTQAEREVTTRGLMSGTSFAISHKNQAHILSILRDRLYTNKILAVLREYSSNAWDAHIDAGKSDVPIKVNLPTQIEPTLYIRDYGKGLSEEDVYEIYAKYGESTKRTTNSQVGMLGIGSKSAFAYSDSFTITSHHGGMKKVYVAVLDSTDMGVINKLHEEPCDEEETGIEIRLPVRPSDVGSFHSTAREFFRFFSPKPDINMKFEELAAEEFKSGFLLKTGTYHFGGNAWTAIMGCVPYRLSLHSLIDKFRGNSGRLMGNHAGGIYLDIGTVDISANREELEYTERTAQAVEAALDALVSEVGQRYRDVVDANTGIERYRAVRKFQRETKFPCPSYAETYLQASLDMSADLFTCRTTNLLWSGQLASQAAYRFAYEDHARIVICDIPRNQIRRKVPDRGDIFLVCPAIPANLMERDPATGKDKMKVDGKLVPTYPCAGTYGLPSADELVQAVKTVLVKHEIDDVPVVLLSSLPDMWEEDEEKRATNIKHRKKVFVRSPNAFNSTEPSKAWDVSDHILQDSDPVLLLDRFVPVNLEGKRMPAHTSRMEADNEIFKSLFGTGLPTVYAVKRTEKVRDYSQVTGTYYYKWVVAQFRTLLAADEKAQQRLSKLFWTGSHGLYELARYGKVLSELLRPQLSADHELVKFFAALANASSYQDVLRSHLDRIQKLAGNSIEIPNPKKEWDALMARYPMLKSFSAWELRDLLQTDSAGVARYIRMEDVFAEGVKLYGLDVVESVPAEDTSADVAELEKPTTTTVNDDDLDEEDND